MRHIRVILLPLVALLLCMQGTSAHARNTHSDHALLWKINGNGLTKPSYLFGTFHLLGSDYVDSLKPLWKAFNATDAMVGEIDMKNIDLQSLVKIALDTIPIKDLMSMADYHFIDSLMSARIGLSIEMFPYMKPAMISTLIEALPYLRQMDSDSGTADAQPMDLHFQSRARELGHSVIGLETATQQAHILFDSIGVKEQARELVEMAHLMIHDTSSGMDLEHCYDTEDLPCIAKSELDGSMTPRELSLLITDRNARWIPRLRELMAQQACFIAVGAGHLVGPGGLIELLSKQGYSVTPIHVHSQK